jgi:hypothetical protein
VVQPLPPLPDLPRVIGAADCLTLGPGGRVDGAVHLEFGAREPVGPDAPQHMLGVFAEFETNLRKERQLEGIAAAKARGVYKGRKPTIDPGRGS